MPLLDGTELNLTTTEHLGVDRCPQCNTANPMLTRRHWFYVQSRKPAYSTPIGGGYLQWHVYTCESCGGLATAACILPSNLVTAVPSRPAAWIVSAPKPISSDVPATAARYLLRARETIASPEASVVMSASVVDAMLKERKYAAGKLYTRIQKAEADGVLTKEMAAWAHDVRLHANDERRADQSATEPTPEDANRCLEFAETIADLLFVLPTRVKRGLKKDQPVS